MLVFKNIIKIIIGISFALITIELFFLISNKTYLWKIFPTVPPILGEPNYELGYKFTNNIKTIWTKENKNLVRINSYGIHDREISENLNNIIVTGNSMIESLQIPLSYNFENMLEDKINNYQILNFGMSGHGPLRQLVMLEKFGYNLKPDLVIMYLPISEFLLNELTDSTFNPGYKINKDFQISRSYNFRNRFQIKNKDNFFMKIGLFVIQNFSLPRLLYLSKDRNINDILGIKKNVHVDIKKNSNNCHTNYISNQHNLWINKYPKSKYFVANYYFEDLANSIKGENFELLLFINGLDYNPECKEEFIKRNIIYNKLKNLTNNYNYKIFDYEKLLYEYYISNKNDNENYINFRKKMLGFGKNAGTGHLNYFGHRVYSDILQNIIFENTLIFNEKN